MAKKDTWNHVAIDMKPHVIERESVQHTSVWTRKIKHATCCESNGKPQQTRGNIVYYRAKHTKPLFARESPRHNYRRLHQDNFNDPLHTRGVLFNAETARIIMKVTTKLRNKDTTRFTKAAGDGMKKAVLYLKENR